VEKQVLIMAVANAGMFDDLNDEAVRPAEAALYQWFDTKYSALLTEIREKRAMTDDSKSAILNAAKDLQAQGWQI